MTLFMRSPGVKTATVFNISNIGNDDAVTKLLVCLESESVDKFA